MDTCADAFCGAIHVNALKARHSIKNLMTAFRFAKICVNDWNSFIARTLKIFIFISFYKSYMHKGVS